jgi:hypothetical protein
MQGQLPQQHPSSSPQPVTQLAQLSNTVKTVAAKQPALPSLEDRIRAAAKVRVPSGVFKTHPVDEALNKVFVDVLKRGEFPQLVELCYQQPKILPYVLHPFVEDFWEEVLQDRHRPKPYASSIELKLHQLEKGYERSPNRPGRRHPFQILAGHYCFVKAERALDAKKEKDHLDYARKGECFGDFGCMSYLVQRQCDRIEEAAERKEQLDGAFLKQLFDAVDRVIEIHWASGYLLKAHCCFQIGLYFANLLGVSKQQDYKAKRDCAYEVALECLTVAKELQPCCAPIIHNNHLNQGLARTVFTADDHNSLADIENYYKSALRKHSRLNDAAIDGIIVSGRVCARQLTGDDHRQRFVI